MGTSQYVRWDDLGAYGLFTLHGTGTGTGNGTNRS